MNPEEMRVKALECDEMVREAHDPAVARRYAELGRQWRAMADEVESKAKQKATG